MKFLMHLIILVFLATARCAWAQQCEFSAENATAKYPRQIAMLETKGCFGGDLDNHPLTIRIHREIEAFGTQLRTTDEVIVVQDAALRSLSEVKNSLAAPPLVLIW